MAVEITQSLGEELPAAPMGKGGPDPKQKKVPLRGERWVAVRQNLLLRSCCDTGVSGPGP